VLHWYEFPLAKDAVNVTLAPFGIVVFDAVMSAVGNGLTVFEMGEV
jgi:hypothetical protein